MGHRGSFPADCCHVARDCDSFSPLKQVLLVVYAAHTGYDAFLCQLEAEAELAGILYSGLSSIS